MASSKAPAVTSATSAARVIPNVRPTATVGLLQAAAAVDRRGREQREAVADRSANAGRYVAARHPARREQLEQLAHEQGVTIARRVDRAYGLRVGSAGRRANQLADSY